MVTLRPMLAADISTVRTIATACAEAPRWQPADYISYLADAPGADPILSRIAIVATHASEIKGFAAVTLRPDAICELDSIAVDPGVRRQGIGAALLRAVLAWAAAHHARHLVLEVRASNAPALHLYEQFGLRIEGRRPRYYTHPEEDALLLGTDMTSESKTCPFSTEKAIEGGRPRC